MPSNYTPTQTNKNMTDYISVTKLNEYVRRYLEENILLSGLAVCGEITNFKRYSSGHIYFNLKDEESVVQCSFFKGDNYSLRFAPQDGMKVVVFGSPTVYAKQGKYQLIVRRMQAMGEGDAALKLEELKNKLREEGLFDQQRKRSLPAYPRKIGVVTSESGAVFHDILNVTHKRAPSVDILLSPVAVQGSDAPNDIIRGLKLIQNYDIDVIIIGRGGGSAEELACFNDEKVVRAVSECRIPIISAVGHETDITWCDLVAEQRAATPSQAAEFAVGNIASVKDAMDSKLSTIEISLMRKISEAEERLLRLGSSYFLRNPQRIVEDKYQQLDDAERRLNACIEKIMLEKENKLGNLCGVIESVSPLKVLARGYGVIFDEQSKCIISSEDIKVGQNVRIRFLKGAATAQITEVCK